MNGCLTAMTYTVIAHSHLLAEMLPADAIVYLMTDAAGSYVAAEPLGFTKLLKENRADLTFVFFAKDLTKTEKQASMAEFRKRMEDFVANGDPRWTPLENRNAFIRAFASRPNWQIASISGEWVICPIETKYEPDKRVGIVHARRMNTPRTRMTIGMNRWPAAGLVSGSARPVPIELDRQNAFQAYRPGHDPEGRGYRSGLLQLRGAHAIPDLPPLNPLAPTVFDTAMSTSRPLTRSKPAALGARRRPRWSIGRPASTRSFTANG